MIGSKCVAASRKVGAIVLVGRALGLGATRATRASPKRAPARPIREMFGGGGRLPQRRDRHVESASRGGSVDPETARISHSSAPCLLLRRPEAAFCCVEARSWCSMARSGATGAPSASLLLAEHPLPTASRRTQGALECLAAAGRFIDRAGRRRRRMSRPLPAPPVRSPAERACERRVNRYSCFCEMSERRRAVGRGAFRKEMAPRLIPGDRPRSQPRSQRQSQPRSWHKSWHRKGPERACVTCGVTMGSPTRLMGGQRDGERRSSRQTNRLRQAVTPRDVGGARRGV